MADYIDFPIDSDPEDILANAISFIQARFPGWDPSRDGNLDVAMLKSLAADIADLKSVASAVPISIFRYFGNSILRFKPIDATPASALTTWTVIDSSGYTIPANTTVSIDSPSGPVPFATLEDVIIFAGGTTASGVLIEALQAGADGSGLGSAGGTVNLEDPLDFVVSVTQTAATSGGVDDELDTEYIARLATDLQLLSMRPILPHDFAVLYRTIPGVFRSTAVDGYNPADATFNNERMVTIFGIDTIGADVDGATKAAGKAYLESLREVNFVVNTASPSLHQIDVTYKVKAVPGADPAAVLSSVNAALAAYLSALNWGTTLGQDPHDWTNQSVVRYLEVAQVINAVQTVDYITTTAGNYDLTIREHSGALARTDVALTGVAPLPTPGVMSGTIT